MDDSTERRVGRALGRELKSSELDVYPNLDALPTNVTDIVAIVAVNNNLILAVRYLRERIRDHSRAMGLNEIVERLSQQWMARWTPSDQAMASRILGRELGLETPSTLAEMDDPSSSVTADGVKLGRWNFILACKYMLHRVPGLHLWGAMCWVEALPDSKPRGA